MAETTTTTLTELIQPIIGEARMWMTDRSLFYPRQGIAQQFLQMKDIRGQAGKAATFPKLGSIAFGDASEGVDYTTTSALDTSAVTVTATPRQCVVELTDEAQYSTEADLIAMAGEALGRAAAKKFDDDVCSVFSSLGTTPTGGNASNSSMTAAEFQAYITQARVANAPGPYAAVFHPWGWYEFLGESSSPLLNAAASDAVAKGVWGDYYAASPFGVTCLTYTGVATANAAADYMGAFLSPWAIGVTWKKDLSVEVQRNATKRCSELVATMHYGVGVVDSTMGFQMLQDAD